MADKKVEDVIAKLKDGKMWKAAEMVAEDAHETLAYYAFPSHVNLGLKTYQSVAVKTYH